VHYNTNTEAHRRSSPASSQRRPPFLAQAELGVSGDVDTLFDAVEAGLKEHNGGDVRLDILVNNAGVMGGSAPADVTPDQFDRLFAVNAKAHSSSSAGADDDARRWSHHQHLVRLTGSPTRTRSRTR